MRNWTIKEAVEVINAGKDTEGIKELAKHFPLFFMAVAKNDVNALAAMMPEKFTVRRLVMDGVASDVDGEPDQTPVENENVEAAEETAADGELNLLAMSTKELIALCSKRGIKVPKYGKNKQFYLDALGSDAGKEKPEPEVEEDEAEEEADQYAGKSAKELFNICKERGIKVAPKQNSKVYLDALKKADAEAVKAEDEADDGWDEEEAEEEAPKQPKKSESKKAAATAAKKSTKPAKQEEEDDGDDWDI